MGIFGWSYPPGCSGPPEHDIYCQVCGEHEDKCDCPECEICGDYGNPECYEKHGLIKGKEMTTKAINEKPILFKGDMVRAILEGRKTQTRRVIEPQEAVETSEDGMPIYVHDLKLPHPCEFSCGNTMLGFCPFGRIGGRLWVRETWQYRDFSENGLPWIKYKSDGNISCRGQIPWEWSDRIENIWAKLSEPENYDIDDQASDRKWRPSIHMPRWASRIDLEITNIRVERLQDISEEDACAEGIELTAKPLDIPFRDYVERFRRLWDSLADEKTNWQANPYVWIIDFKRVEG